MAAEMDMLKLLECPICLQTLERPESLPCMHTFCALCIREHIAKSANPVVCPICRQVVPITPGSNNLSTVLKKDFFKAQLLELLLQSSGSAVSATTPDTNNTISTSGRNRPLPPLPQQPSSSDTSRTDQAASQAGSAMPTQSISQRPQPPPPPLRQRPIPPPRSPSFRTGSDRQRHSAISLPVPVQLDEVAPSLPPRSIRWSAAHTTTAGQAANHVVSASGSPFTSSPESSSRPQSPILASLSSLFPNRIDIATDDGALPQPSSITRIVDTRTRSSPELQRQQPLQSSGPSHLPSTSVTRRPVDALPSVPSEAVGNSLVTPATLRETISQLSTFTNGARPTCPALPPKTSTSNSASPAAPAASSLYPTLPRNSTLRDELGSDNEGLIMVNDHFGDSNSNLSRNSALNRNLLPNTVIPAVGQRHQHTDLVPRENNDNSSAVYAADSATIAPPTIVPLRDEYDQLWSFQTSSQPPPLHAPPRHRTRDRPVTMCLFSDVQPNAPFLNYDKDFESVHRFTPLEYVAAPHRFTKCEKLYPSNKGASRRARRAVPLPNHVSP